MPIQTTTASQKKNDTSQTKGHDLRAADLRVLSECVCSYRGKYDATAAQNDAPNSPKATTVMKQSDQAQNHTPKHRHKRECNTEIYHRILLMGHYEFRDEATQSKCDGQRANNVNGYSPHSHETRKRIIFRYSPILRPFPLCWLVPRPIIRILMSTVAQPPTTSRAKRQRQ